MKKIVALVLSFVMIFSFAMPSFALTSDEQANDLMTGWGSTSSSPSSPTGYSHSWFYLMLYHTYQIRQTLNNIDTDTSNIYSRVGLINNSVSDLLINSNFIKVGVSSIEDYSKLINSTLNSVKFNSDSILSNVESLVNYVDNVENLITTTNNHLSSILSDTDMLQKVLADEDDLAFKNSQKQNQEIAQDSFFTPGNGSSIDSDQLVDLKSSTDSFFGSIDLSFYGSDFPLIHLGEGSEWLLLFTDESSLDMDPSFTPPPPTETPTPPKPEVTATPTISYSESSFTVSASGQGTVILYVDGSQVSNPYTFTQTSESQSFTVTATAQEEGKLISSIARVDIIIPAYVSPKPEVTATPTISYSETNFTVSASGLGTVILYVNGSQVSNPYTFTQTSESQSFTVTATAQEEGKLISSIARVDIIIPAYVSPKPEVTATPTISYSETNFTVSASGQGTVILYVNGSQVSNPYTFTQTYDVQSFTVTATAQEDGKEISSTASLSVSVPAKVKPKAPTPTLTYDENTLTVTASLSSTPDGVYIFLYVDGEQVNNPYTFTQTAGETSYTVTAYSSGSDYFKSDTVTLTVTVPAYVPEPEPLVNFLPLATTEPDGSTVFNTTGYKTRTTISSNPFSPSSSSSYSLTGWIPVSPGDTVYIYNFYPASGTLRVGYSSDVSGSQKGVTSVDISKDGNGVLSYTVPSDVHFLRFSPSDNTGFTSSSVISVNQYPVETSSFSLRSYNYSHAPVTSYYTARENLFFYLLKLFSLR